MNISKFYKNKLSALNLLIFLFIFSSGYESAFSLPSYARQTGLACNNCHIAFPQLNNFGRIFKLNAYTMASGETIEAQADSTSNILKIMKNLPFSSMVQASITHLGKTQPNTLNDNISFPQQLSFFMAGIISPKVGVFLQVTYNAEAGTFGWDNTDIRYADNGTIFSTDLTYGFSLNNSPGVQDLWHTTPTWGFPFANPSGSLAPMPGSTPLISGALAQQVAGVTAYAMWENLVYTEIGAYRSAQQAAHYPADSSVTNYIKGLMPYWRLAIQQSWENNYFSIGTFGLIANTIPTGINGQANQYTDVGADIQFEHQMETDYLTAYLTWIHESQNLPSSVASGASQNSNNTLSTLKLNVNYFFLQRFNLGLGFFNTTGSADNLLYTPGTLTGYNGNIPDSQGITAEFDFLPWYNTKFALQYTIYNKFNGASSNYDGSGRNASDNNALYLGAWFMF